MTLDTALNLVRVITPFVTLLLLLLFAILGWLIPFLIRQLQKQIETLKFDLTADVESLKKDLTEKMDDRGCQLDNRIARLEKAVKNLEQSRIADQKYMLEKFVTGERFMGEAGKNNNLFDRVFGRMDNLSASLNILIGQLQERNKKEHG